MSLDRVVVHDLSNPGGWSAEKKARQADLWILYWSATEQNTLGLRGPRLVHFQPGLPITPSGLPYVDQPYPAALLALAEKYGARTGQVLFPGGDGGYLERLDLTRRGFVVAVARLLVEMFGTFEGTNLDYYCRPDSLGVTNKATGARVTFAEDYLLAHDVALRGLTATLRALKPEWIILGQCDRMTGDTWGDASGCYIEQSWKFNGRTAVIHASDLKAHADLLSRFDPKRRLVSVLEVREPQWLTRDEMDLVRAWCIGQGLYLSVGRDATALGRAGLPS